MIDISLEEITCYRDWNVVSLKETEILFNQLPLQTTKIAMDYIASAENEKDPPKRAYLYSSARRICSRLQNLNNLGKKLEKDAHFGETSACWEMAKNSSDPFQAAWALKVIQFLDPPFYKERFNLTCSQEVFDKYFQLSQVWKIVGDVIKKQRIVSVHLAAYIQFSDPIEYAIAQCYLYAALYIENIFRQFKLNEECYFYLVNTIDKLFKEIDNLFLFGETIEKELDEGSEIANFKTKIYRVSFLSDYFKTLGKFYQCKLNMYDFFNQNENRIVLIKKTVEICKKNANRYKLIQSLNPMFYYEQAVNFSQAVHYIEENKEKNLLLRVAERFIRIFLNKIDDQEKQLLSGEECKDLFFFYDEEKVIAQRILAFCIEKIN